MAKTYRKHRYNGIKLLHRQIKRKLVDLSIPLAWALTVIYLLLPWFLPLEDVERAILIGIGIISGAGACMWRDQARMLGNTMDTIAAGHDGEGEVAKLLTGLPRNWAVLNDLALRAGGPIVQIDHIVITPAGVHVLETKTQKGKIISAPMTGKWHVQRRGTRKTMSNPIQQNKTQVAACQHLLKELAVNIPCHGLVVMTQAMTRAEWPIVKAEDLTTYLGNHTQKNRQALTPTQMRELAKALLSFQVKGQAPWQKSQRHWWFFALTMLAPLFLYVLTLLVIVL